MLVYAPGWSLASQFWSYTPTPKRQFFSGQKNENSPLKMGCARPLLQKIQTYFLFLLLLRLFLSEILSRRSRLSRTTNDRSQKVKIFRSKLPFISCLFSGKKIGTILSRRSRLSRTSRAPSRLIRPRPFDCDRESGQIVKSLTRCLWPIVFEHRQKKIV